MPLTPAEKQAAYRARQNALRDTIGQGHVGDFDPRGLDAGIPSTGQELRQDAELEVYVARELAVTQAQIDKGMIKTHALQDGKPVFLDPLLRSERYARWRYVGFKAGEIASL